MSNPNSASRDLIVLRRKFGARTPAGRTCSNILEQMDSLKTYVRPEWATHETQTLQWCIKQQMQRLAQFAALT